MTAAGQEPTIRPATDADSEPVARIYNHYVTGTIVTFEEEPVSPPEIAGRIGRAATASLPWLVAELAGQVVGYAYAGPWHARAAYRFSAEITVYLDHARVGRRIGSRLYWQRVL